MWIIPKRSSCKDLSLIHIFSDELSYRYGISTRPGAHCAPLMHQSMGTVDQGMVRFSFSWFNTKEEVDLAIQAIRELAERCV